MDILQRCHQYLFHADLSPVTTLRHSRNAKTGYIHFFRFIIFRVNVIVFMRQILQKNGYNRFLLRGDDMPY